MIIKYICLFLLPIVHYYITKNLEIIKTMNFEQMEQVNGGSWLGFGCGVFMTSWAGVLAYGAAAAALTAGASVAITLVWGIVGTGVCAAIDN